LLVIARRILKAHGSGKTAQGDQLAYPKGKLIERIGLPAYAWDRDSDDLHGYACAEGKPEGVCDFFTKNDDLPRQDRDKRQEN
jgi:hypothetical protein